MKVEVGESLVYSYLSHIKSCQIVQTNWKLSPSWKKYNENEIELFIENAREHFKNKFNYNIFKKTISASQILKQCECDVVGVCVNGECNLYYSVDVAFHEEGLNYKSKKESAEKVTSKLIKAAMCLYGSCDAKNGEIIFASPKITPAVMNELTPCINDINELFKLHNMNFIAKIIANNDFKTQILEPILNSSKKIADTSELFVRSYQLIRMFDE